MTNLNAARNNPAVYTELTNKSGFPDAMDWDNVEAYRMQLALVNAGVNPANVYTGAYASTLR